MAGTDAVARVRALLATRDPAAWLTAAERERIAAAVASGRLADVDDLDPGARYADLTAQDVGGPGPERGTGPVPPAAQVARIERAAVALRWDQGARALLAATGEDVRR